VVGGLLVVIAAVCAALAAARLKQRSPHFPTLTSRLRVAIKSSPIKPDQIEAARDTAAAILSAPPSPAPRRRRRPNQTLPGNRTVPAGLILAASLLGWAAVRRHRAPRTEA
jgi:hypothetical protein